MNWVEHILRIEEMDVLVEKPERMRPFGNLRHRWEENMKMDHQNIGWEVVD